MLRSVHPPCNVIVMETTTRWGFEAPTTVIVPSYHVTDFLIDAPEGTIIEAGGDLYMTIYGEGWIELEHVVTGYSGVTGAYAEYETVSYWTLDERIIAGDHKVRVLRLGE